VLFILLWVARIVAGAAKAINRVVALDGRGLTRVVLVELRNPGGRISVEISTSGRSDMPTGNGPSGAGRRGGLFAFHADRLGPTRTERRVMALDFDLARAATLECVTRIQSVKQELLFLWERLQSSSEDTAAFDAFQRDAVSTLATAHIAAREAFTALGLACTTHGQPSPILDAIKRSDPKQVGVAIDGQTYATYHEAAYFLLGQFSMIPSLVGDTVDGPSSVEILNVPRYCQYANNPAGEYERLLVLLTRRSRAEQEQYWRNLLAVARQFSTIDFDRLKAGIDKEWAKARQTADTTTPSPPVKTEHNEGNGGEDAAEQTTRWDRLKKWALNNRGVVVFLAICAAVALLVALGSGLETIFSWIRRCIDWARR